MILVNKENMKKIIRSKEEILNYYKQDSGFGFKEDVLEYLPFDDVKQFYKEDFVKAIESGQEQYITKTDPLIEAKEYLEFAWGKANDRRGLSAGRSISHFLNWFWLVDENFYEKLLRLEDECYSPYGKPILVIVSEKLGIDWKNLDDGCWCEQEDGEDWSKEEVESTILKARKIIDQLESPAS